MKCYAIRRSDGQYLKRHYGAYSSFNPFYTKFFSMLKAAKNTVLRGDTQRDELNCEVVEFELMETKTYEV